MVDMLLIWRAFAFCGVLFQLNQSVGLRVSFSEFDVLLTERLRYIGSEII